jgi:hypothetical protein
MQARPLTFSSHYLGENPRKRNKLEMGITKGDLADAGFLM